MSAAHILDYHIKNKITDTSENEKALVRLDVRIKQAMQEYSGKLKEGELAIQNLVEQLACTCESVQRQRKYILNCMERVRKNYSKIGPAIHKINNIKKVIEITSIWGKAKLPYLLSIDTTHPHRYDLADVLNLIDSALLTIQSSSAT